MKRMLGTLVVVVVACIVACVAGQSQASILGNWITGDGIEDHFKDNSRVDFIDNGDGVVSVGDVFRGILRIDERVDNAPTHTFVPPAETIVGVFSFQVTTAPAGGNNLHQYGAIPVGHASGWDLKSLLDVSLQGAVDDATWSKSIFAVIEKNTADPTLSPPAFPYGSGYTLDMVGGIQPGSADFFEATMDSISYAVIAGINNGTIFGSEAGGFSVFYNSMGLDFLPINVTHRDLVTVTQSDVRFSANVQGTTAPGWLSQDNANIDFNAVPEPVSLLCWLGLGIAFAFAAWRRRRNA